MTANRMQSLMGRIALCGMMVLQIWSCVRDPAAPRTEAPTAAGAGLYVLNEGLFGRDNASLTYHDFATGETVQNYFQKVNPGLRLGDTANSLALSGGLGFIVMNGSNLIHIIDLATAESRGRILLPGNPSPRQAVILDDSTGYVTALYEDAVLKFDPLHKTVTGRIAVGPAPEGICRFEGRLFVANSGLGDIRANEPGAGTVSIIDLRSEKEVLRLPVMRNCTQITVGPDGRIYVVGTGSYSEEVVSGVAVVDPIRLTVVDTLAVPGHPRDFVLLNDGRGFVLTDSAVTGFDWRKWEVTDLRFIPRDRVSASGWLSALAVSAARQEIYVADARDFVTDGEVVVFDFFGREKYRFSCKLNPGFIHVLK